MKYLFIVFITLILNNFSFSYVFNIGSTGLLLPYSLGIISYLKNNNIKSNKLIGTSGGAFCSIIYNYENNLSHDKLWYDIFNLNKNTTIGLHNLGLFQKNTINYLINRYNDNYTNFDNINIIVTKYNSILSKEKIIFDNFDNNTDLLYKCYCSSYIPYISGNKYYYKYNNNKFLDGAFNKKSKIENNKYEYLTNNDIKININCNLWDRKFNLDNRYYLDIKNSKELFDYGWKDTEKNFHLLFKN